MVGHDKIVEFLYLPYVLVFLFFYVVAVGYVCSYFFDRKLYYTRNSEHQRHRQPFCCLPDCNGCVNLCTASVAYPLIRGTTAYQAALFGDHGTPILGFVRIVGLLVTAYLVYFCGLLEYGHHYFMWCGVASVVYFLVAYCCFSLPETIKWCMRHMYHPNDRPSKPVLSLLYERIVSFLVVYRSVVLANCVFVSVTQYDLHEGPTLTNTLRLIPSVCLGVDFFFSLMPVSLEHYIYVLCVPYVFIHYHWTRVYREKDAWESEYVEVDSPICFRNYCIMLAIHLAIYLVLCGVQKYIVFGQARTPMKSVYHIPEYAHILEMNTAHDSSHYDMDLAMIEGDMNTWQGGDDQHVYMPVEETFGEDDRMPQASQIDPTPNMEENTEENVYVAVANQI